MDSTTSEDPLRPAPTPFLIVALILCGVACAGSGALPLVTSGGVRAFEVDDVDVAPRLVTAVSVALPGTLARYPCRGEVSLAFVVLPDGTVDSSTVRALAATDSLLVGPAVHAARKARYVGGEWGGERVPVGLRQVFRTVSDAAPFTYDDQCLGSFRAAEALGRTSGCIGPPGSRSLNRVERWSYFPTTQAHFQTYLNAADGPAESLVGIWETRDGFSRIGHPGGDPAFSPHRFAIFRYCGYDGWEYAGVPLAYYWPERDRLKMLYHTPIGFVLHASDEDDTLQLRFPRDPHQYEHSAQLLGDRLIFRAAVGTMRWDRVRIEP